MTGKKDFTGFGEQQMASAALFGKPLFENFERACRWQSSRLDRVEAVLTEALQRRRNSCEAMERFAAQLSDAHDPSVLIKAQQEWFSGAVQRMLADATAWQTAGTLMLQGLNSVNELRASSAQIDPEAAPEAAPGAAEAVVPRRPVKVA
ncbi:MAG: phasin family protein [Acidocella sp.]|uniref:phasin family protein n=1 Tax=Acidocella sp. TaxID=50710 RepID=UPI003FC798C0